MSKNIYKIEFEYDDNCGNRYQPISKFVCYEIINNMTDYTRIIDEEGLTVELSGSDSFIDNLIYCINRGEFEEIRHGYNISKKEIPYSEIKDII